MCFSQKTPKYFEFLFFLFAEYDNMEDCASVKDDETETNKNGLTFFFFHLNLQN